MCASARYGSIVAPVTVSCCGVTGATETVASTVLRIVCTERAGTQLFGCGATIGCVEGGYGLGWKGGRPYYYTPFGVYGSYDCYNRPYAYRSFRNRYHQWPSPSIRPELTWPNTAPMISTPSQPHSTADHERPWAGRRPPKPSTIACWATP